MTPDKDYMGFSTHSIFYSFAQSPGNLASSSSYSFILPSLPSILAIQVPTCPLMGPFIHPSLHSLIIHPVIHGPPIQCSSIHLFAPSFTHPSFHHCLFIHLPTLCHPSGQSFIYHPAIHNPSFSPHLVLIYHHSLTHVTIFQLSFTHLTFCLYFTIC